MTNRSRAATTISLRSLAAALLAATSLLGTPRFPSVEPTDIGFRNLLSARRNAEAETLARERLAKDAKDDAARRYLTRVTMDENKRRIDASNGGS
jgi:hypothetical protein